MMLGSILGALQSILEGIGRIDGNGEWIGWDEEWIGWGIVRTFRNKIHTAHGLVIYPVHTQLVTTYITPNPTSV